MCLPKNKVKATKLKVQSLGLIILQFAALVTHDLAVRAEQTRRSSGADAAHARSERGGIPQLLSKLEAGWLKQENNGHMKGDQSENLIGYIT